MATSITDVAKSAGVSASTVSRAFTHPELVSNQTRMRILEIAEKLNFSISRSATALKSGKTLRIALLISGHIHRWFSASIIEGLNDVFHAKGYDISIFQISSAEERDNFFSMLPIRRNADAVIVISMDVDSQELARLRQTSIPIIGINCTSTSQNGFAVSVNIDDEQGSTLAAHHLLNLGHRSIAYVRNQRATSLRFSVQHRYDAFMSFCQQRGITPMTITASDGPGLVSRILSQILNLRVLPTAIACQEDSIAIPLIFQLQRTGISVPDDISIIGYDDTPIANDIGLTTIHQNPITLARKAALKTLALIETGQCEQPFETQDARLVIRSSTAKATGGAKPVRTAQTTGKR
ncbi:MAG: LacI family DNA-binding transcriptional regulator [Bifidobacterium sp.]|nr:LacI family DNA-binding transcriptional regulator [Bifidobacterium sp.]